MELTLNDEYAIASDRRQYIVRRREGTDWKNRCYWRSPALLRAWLADSGRGAGLPQSDLEGLDRFVEVWDAVRKQAKNAAPGHAVDADMFAVDWDGRQWVLTQTAHSDRFYFAERGDALLAAWDNIARAAKGRSAEELEAELRRLGNEFLKAIGKEALEPV